MNLQEDFIRDDESPVCVGGVGGDRSVSRMLMAAPPALVLLV